ncbi:unnamed protein product [Larinioides sclopetarius]
MRYVFPPQLQDLATWHPASGISNSKEMWEISAPPDHSLYWSLALAFIIASPDNSDWLERLLGSKEEREDLMRKKKIPVQNWDSKSIRRQVMNFNPFKNQHSFYFNQDLINVFRMFRLRLNRTASQMRRNSVEWSDDMKLKAATKMLKCCIKVYETDSAGAKQQPSVYAPVSGRAELVLFKHSDVAKQYKSKPPSGQGDDHKVINIFGFGMNLHHVVPLRRDALGHILKRTDLSQQIINGIQRDFTGGGNFLVSLLEKDCEREAVPSIYASPYIAWKLAAAGFVTDPCCLLGGDELSAFYHCMELDSTLPLRVLYDYASNSFEHSDKTTRNPDPEILRALERIGQALQNDFSKSNGFSKLGDKKDVALKCHDEISCFNEYQRLVIEEIDTLQRSLPPQVDDDEVVMMRRKHIIRSLLNLYPKYFDYPKINGPTDQSKYITFQNFIQHSEYYENLDNYTCLLFFDNFLYLDLPADLMNSAVQNLFLTVFGYRLFPKCVHGVHCTKHVLTTEDCALRVIPFIFRSNFLESAKAVLQKLESQTRGSSKKRDPNSVLVQVTSGLKHLPEIKDEFLIGRLRKYLDTGIKVPLSGSGLKGVLVVERALQVIGETLNTSESSSVIGHLLCSCLGGVVEEFFKIRNHILSHYRPRMMGGKFSLEKEIVVFENIQDVVKEVDSLVQPVIVSQSLRIMDYMVETGVKGSEDIDPALAQNMKKEHCGKTRLLLEIYTRSKSKYKCLTNNLLDYIEGEAGIEKCHKFRKSGQMSALKFLFVFLASQCDEADKNDIHHILQDLDRLKRGFESKASAVKKNEIEISTSESQEITKLVSDLRKISDFIFSEVKDEPTKVIDPSRVATFFTDARKFRWFTDDEMATIKQKISEHLQQSREAKATLKEYFGNKCQLSESEAQKLVEAIFASKKDKTCISTNLSSNPGLALKTLNSIKRDEQDVFMKRGRDDDLDCLLTFSDSDSIEGVHLLLKIGFPDDLRRKVLQFLNRKVEFLLDRVGHLKSILIDEDEEILSLWNWGKSEAIRTHTRFLMCERYRREREVRASLEMLLFDCMNILIKRKSLSRLWSKANDLFSGASLRDILSHGSTILEIVGGCLDKDDLPSHLIEKMLELIEDGDALRTLSDLWEKAKITDLKQFESMLEADDPSLREVKKWMKKRPATTGGWKDYLPLLPLK